MVIEKHEVIENKCEGFLLDANMSTVRERKSQCLSLLDKTSIGVVGDLRPMSAISWAEGTWETVSIGERGRLTRREDGQNKIIQGVAKHCRCNDLLWGISFNLNC